MAGKTVATIGSMHVCPMVAGYIPHVGGPVSGPGMPGVTVGPNTPTPDAVMPLKKIPFPKISLLDIVGAAVKGKGKDLKQARKNQEAIKKAAEEGDKDAPPRILDVQMVDENRHKKRGVKLDEKTYILATFQNVKDGATATIVLRHDTQDGEEITKLKGEVKDGELMVEWTADSNYYKEKDNEQ